MEIEGVLLYLGSWVTLITGIWTLFDKISSVTSAEFNNKVTLWIQNISFHPNNSQAKNVIYGMFIRFFGEMHFSFKCLYRSALYSLFVFIICTFLSMFKMKNFNPSEVFPNNDWQKLILILIYMLFQDYLALFKTRFVLKLLLKGNLDIFPIIIIDIILTFFIYFFVIGIGQLFYNGEFYINKIIKIGKLYWSSSFSLTSLYLNSIFLGTLWVLIIQFAGLFTKLFSKLFQYFNWFKSVIDIQKQPIKSLGVISVLVVTVCYIVGLPVFLLVHK